MKGQSTDHFLLRRPLSSTLNKQSRHGSTLEAAAAEQLSFNYNCQLSGVIAQGVTPSKRSLTEQQYRAIQWRLYGSSRKFLVLKCHDDIRGF